MALWVIFKSLSLEMCVEIFRHKIIILAAEIQNKWRNNWNQIGHVINVFDDEGQVHWVPYTILSTIVYVFNFLQENISL